MLRRMYRTQSRYCQVRLSAKWRSPKLASNPDTRTAGGHPDVEMLDVPMLLLLIAGGNVTGTNGTMRLGHHTITVPGTASK
jgi:hypothetical protein